MLFRQLNKKHTHLKRGQSVLKVYVILPPDLWASIFTAISPQRQKSNRPESWLKNRILFSFYSSWCYQKLSQKVDQKSYEIRPKPYNSLTILCPKHKILIMIIKKIDLLKKISRNNKKKQKQAAASSVAYYQKHKIWDWVQDSRWQTESDTFLTLFFKGLEKKAHLVYGHLFSVQVQVQYPNNKKNILPCHFLAVGWFL